LPAAAVGTGIDRTFLKGKNVKMSLRLINYHAMESYVVVDE
jgi:hypothetical protein